MSITEKIQQDMIAAMKAKDEKLGTIRMVKSSLKNKEIDKREPLTDAEEFAVLSTMVKQRKDSIEQFTKGGRPELAAIEQKEIVMKNAMANLTATGARVEGKTVNEIVKRELGGK